MALPKSIVYILKSEQDPYRYYTGLTSNLSTRLDAHNAGHCSHTLSGRPRRRGEHLALSPPGLAYQLLDGLQLQMTVYVTDQPNVGFGSGLGRSSECR